MRPALRPAPTTPLPGPTQPPTIDDPAFAEQGLLLALRAHLTDPDPDVQKLCAQWAAEAAVLQEIRRGWNDPG